MLPHEEIRFRAGDQALVGNLVLPPGAGRHPWALLVGSWLPRDRDGSFDHAGHPGWFDSAAGQPPGLLARLADALAARGVASFRYDPRGCGASPGAWEATDLFTRIDDARDAVGAMRSRPELDLRRMAIVGHGEGALVATTLAISDPVVAAVGLIGAAARPTRDVIRRGVAARSRTGTDLRHPAVAALDRWSEELIERAERREVEARLVIGAEIVSLKLAGLEQAIHTPLLALATMLHRNVLLVHGADDAWSHPAEATLLADTLAAGVDRPTIDIVDGAGHDLAEATDERIGDIAAALAARIEPRELPPVLVAIEQMTDGGG